MAPAPTMPVVVAADAAARLARAAGFLATVPPGQRVLIVGATRGAADELARLVARDREATIGLERLGLAQLAARAAAPWLAAHGLAPATPLGLDAAAARAVHDTQQDAPLTYLRPVAGMPGFAPALAATARDLDGAGVTGDALARAARSGPDLARLTAAYAGTLAQARAASPATVLQAAASQVAARPPADVLVLLDVPVPDPATARFVAACLRSARLALATVPAHDTAALDACLAAGGVVERLDETAAGSLGRLRHGLFASGEAPGGEQPRDGSVELWSAPGEARETVEIARRLLDEARRGVPFDEMAVLLRNPAAYAGLLEHACRRAGVPLWSERGAQRPHQSGRAFLALVACAAEGLPASRFAEYLSLGQVPSTETGGAVPEPPLTGGEDPFGRDDASADADPADLLDVPSNGELADDGAGDSSGVPRAPWRWERLLVDASVIGGDPARWRRRLDGLLASLAVQADEAARLDGDVESPRAAAIRTARDEVARLAGFALPIIETLAAWPREARWGEWLDRLDALAPRVLRAPRRVREVCAELRPMAEVGPVTLDDVRRVLADRLLDLQVIPGGRRYGKVFVGTPEQARGRTFRVVFLPGLAERVFPQRPREDPLLLDAGRAQVSADLPDQDARLAVERGRLWVALGAASERVSVSYPRVDVGEGRARVPSLYALEIVRAATGRLPAHEELEALARDAGEARLGWPAPVDAARAIDEQEHDLAVLRPMLERAPDEVRGHAHYLLKLNDALRRSVVDRWAKGARRWSPQDGLTRVTAGIEPWLQAARLTSRAYSLSTLQRFTACPYQFLLGGLLRLQPRLSPAPLDAVDPLTRGSLLHETQARTLRHLQASGALPLTPASRAEAEAALDTHLDAVAAEFHDRLAPAVERVWRDAVAGIRRDLLGWLVRLETEASAWMPAYFELGFGTVPGVRDPRSLASDVVVGEGFRLRGAVDLVERSTDGATLRVTDHKSGRVPDGIGGVTVGGGRVLQPVLYGLAVEQVLGQPVKESRLWYCTAAGGYQQHVVPLTDITRRTGLEVLTVVDRAIAQGTLPAAPDEPACERCDFRIVCGPGVARRVRQKPAALLADVEAVRSLP